MLEKTETEAAAGAVSGAAPGRRLRALALAGGGFNTAQQLGIAHALLVARGVAPDYVAGISAGAVNAAAIAEILQAGERLPDKERRTAQVDSLRRFLSSYYEMPDELLRSILPDTFEINAQRPLEPIRSPILFAEERDQRRGANQARAGLIRVLNLLFEVRLPVSTITRICSTVLNYVAAAEKETSWDRFWVRCGCLGRLWRIGLQSAFQLAPNFWSLVGAAVRGPVGSRRDVGLSAYKLLSRLDRFRRPMVRLLGDIAFLLIWLLVLLGTPLFLGHVAVRLALRRRGTFWSRVLNRILEHYGVGDGLGNTYVLKSQLIRCFDPQYFGKIDMESVVERALARSETLSKAEAPAKSVAWFGARERERPIVVAPIAADVATGDLQVLPEDVPIVDALLAATAIVPVFPAVELPAPGPRRSGSGKRRFFIDGINVSNEPIGPLMDLLREDPRLDAAQEVEVDIYPVAAAPTGLDRSGKEELAGSVKIALRALRLSRLRDATIDERLARLYYDALPKGKARVRIAGDTYVRANVLPLLVEKTRGINREIFQGNGGKSLKVLIHEAVADGCRAALESMVAGEIAAVPQVAGQASVCCKSVIASRLKSAFTPLPGSDEALGPGLAEICCGCALNREGTGEEAGARRLLVRADRKGWPEWPIDGATTPTPPEVPSREEAVTEERGTESPQIHFAESWPRERGLRKGSQRPVVSLLFGGGVFRGVFHVGVMNALNELGIEPDLVAGSSVGSIVAAMIAQVFAQERGAARGKQIADLAATFVAIDKLVMTDRLADFVRGLTVRAGDARFSARDLDLVLRRYDFDSSGQFDRRTRKVIAGLERLFYLTPFRLFELVKAAREHDFRSFGAALGKALQGFLDRGGVGREILGAEPLALLIREQVIRPLAPQASDELFESFARRGIYFLATATDLTTGRLEILGSPQASSELREVSLLYGLLASSAFPFVFRPRAAWEIFRHATTMDQFVDGGTIDNLPFDAVVDFLSKASRQTPAVVARRPRVKGHAVPHLLFTASLEVDKVCLEEAGVEKVGGSFLQLLKRAGTFRANRKVDRYGATQQRLRAIYEAQENPSWTPLDLHLLAVKPRWLCDTFGFHPMLGFRRKKQIQSIAHGCASTLSTFFLHGRENPAWARAWGVARLADVDPRAVVSNRDRSRPALNPQRVGKTSGQCWFRRTARCPFSEEELGKLQLGSSTSRELSRIYESCGKVETHRAKHEGRKAD